MFRFDGKRALVTGGTSGIGRAIADALAAHGADVLRHGIEPDAELRGDLSDAADLEKISVHARDVDILVLSASVQTRGAWTDIDLAQARRQFDINSIAPLRLMQAAVPCMLDRGWGRVLALGSVQLTRPHPDMAAYAASKSALASTVRNVARQVARGAVTVNMLSPGVIETPRNTAALADPDYRAQVVSAIPAGRIGSVEDCVGAALLLCSDAGGYITGQDVAVDGGMSL